MVPFPADYGIVSAFHHSPPKLGGDVQISYRFEVDDVDWFKCKLVLIRQLKAPLEESDKDDEFPGQFHHCQFTYNNISDYPYGVTNRRYGLRNGVWDRKLPYCQISITVARARLGFVDSVFCTQFCPQNIDNPSFGIPPPDLQNRQYWDQQSTLSFALSGKYQGELTHFYNRKMKIQGRLGRFCEAIEDACAVGYRQFNDIPKDTPTSAFPLPLAWTVDTIPDQFIDFVGQLVLDWDILNQLGDCLLPRVKHVLDWGRWRMEEDGQGYCMEVLDKYGRKIRNIDTEDEKEVQWCQEKRALQHAYDTVVWWLAERWLDATYREIRLEANLKKHHPYFFNDSEVVWWMEPREKLEHPFGDIPLSRLRTEKSNSTPQTVYINTKKSLLVSGRLSSLGHFSANLT